MAIASCPTEAETGEGSILDITGRGSVEVKPDIAYIRLSVSTSSPKAAQSLSSNAETTQAVLGSLKSLIGKEDRISTLGYRLFPEYRYDKETRGRELLGYRAVNAVLVETKALDRVGVIIDAAIKSGANGVESIEFGAEDRERAKKEALRKAIKDAMGRADAAAEASGVKIVRITLISIGGAEPPVIARDYQMLREGAASKAPPTPIEPGEITVEATVRMKFEIK